ncbi:MAG TPA: diguanylate cyclase [Roseiarcus sp.]|nr:diguanylate cyclase [Roseiarcus sp.]
MLDRRAEPRRRILKQAKIFFNRRRSVIDCLVRNLSETGACLEVVNPVGTPDRFDLLIEGETAPRPCVSVWRYDSKIGVAFSEAAASGADEETVREGKPVDAARPLASGPLDDGADLVRGELLALRAALDEVEVGVVLLDGALRAQFINRAFRKMWRLPDAKAQAKPSFAALMHHGAETGQYEIAPQDLSAYIAERIEQVAAGDSRPRDLRLSNGDVIRFQCAPLPGGGRMLSYTYIGDIVRQTDELAALRAALDNIDLGVILLDADLNAQFINLAARRLGRIGDAAAERRPSFAEILHETRRNGAFAIGGAELDALIALRVAQVRAGAPEPMDLRAADGRIVRAQCAVLPNGARMLTYGDVSDLVHQVDELHAHARIDPATGVANRQHFLELAEIEWSRYCRYQRPLSLMMIDVDHFKTINDAFGRQAGDRVLADIARTLHSVKRYSDALGRIGGEEFAVLLPETTLPQAKMAAERFRRAVAEQSVAVNGEPIKATVSIGVAEAWEAAANVAALMNRADQALYLAKSAGRNRVETARPAPVFALG